VVLIRRVPDESVAGRGAKEEANDVIARNVPGESVAAGRVPKVEAVVTSLVRSVPTQRVVGGANKLEAIFATAVRHVSAEDVAGGVGEVEAVLVLARGVPAESVA